MAITYNPYNWNIRKNKNIIKIKQKNNNLFKIKIRVRDMKIDGCVTREELLDIFHYAAKYGLE